MRPLRRRAVEGGDEVGPRVAAFEDHDDREAGVRGHVAADHRDDGRERPSVARGQPELACPPGFSSRISTIQSAAAAASGSAAIAGVPTVTNGTSQRATTSKPGVESSADHRALRPVGAEQRQLRLEVLAHVGVVVEVVVGEVGEAGDVEDEAVHAVTAERLRAHLDGDGFDAALAHEREERVELGCLGGREPRHDDLARDVALGGRRQSGDDAELAEDPLEQVRHARLAVRAGRAEQDREVVVRARCRTPTPTVRRAWPAGPRRRRPGARSLRRGPRPRHPSRSRPRPSPQRRRANSAPWRLTPRIATNASPGRRSAVARVIPLSSTPDVSPRDDSREARHEVRQRPDRRVLRAEDGRQIRGGGVSSRHGASILSSGGGFGRGCTARGAGHGPLLGAARVRLACDRHRLPHRHRRSWSWASPCRSRCTSSATCCPPSGSACASGST